MHANSPTNKANKRWNSNEPTIFAGATSELCLSHKWMNAICLPCTIFCCCVTFITFDSRIFLASAWSTELFWAMSLRYFERLLILKRGHFVLFLQNKWIEWHWQWVCAWQFAGLFDDKKKIWYSFFWKFNRNETKLGILRIFYSIIDSLTFHITQHTFQLTCLSFPMNVSISIYWSKSLS